MFANPADDPSDIFMWQRVEAWLTTSGQPSEGELPALQALGVSHVINLAPHSNDSALPDEPGSVAALGMAYIHIPVDFAAPTEADYARFREVMHALEGQTVHVHCAANLRVSAFVYRYRRDELMLDEQEARAAMERIWRPGGKWAAFVGSDGDSGQSHRYAGRDY